MPAYHKIQRFVKDVAHGVHNLGSDVIKVALTNTAPDAASDTVFADLTEIAAGNGYTAGGAVLTRTSSDESAGTYRLKLADLTITASGGSIGPYRYAVLYNATAPGGPLIGFYDRGSSFSIADGESFVIDFDDVNGVIILE